MLSRECERWRMESFIEKKRKQKSWCIRDWTRYSISLNTVFQVRFARRNEYGIATTEPDARRPVPEHSLSFHSADYDLVILWVGGQCWMKRLLPPTEKIQIPDFKDTNGPTGRLRFAAYSEVKSFWKVMTNMLRVNQSCSRLPLSCFFCGKQGRFFCSLVEKSGVPIPTDLTLSISNSDRMEWMV